ncbi:MAG: hypothetical protein NZ527_04070 [Hydrogenobacter thermophilus]|nr:hypothetical protein [Hydrogenobacter thermophilus]
MIKEAYTITEHSNTEPLTSWTRKDKSSQEPIPKHWTLPSVPSGEAVLCLNHPVYKRRYGVSTDFYLGCRIACKFCYYRFGDTSAYFHRKAQLKKLASPEAYANIIQNSRLVRDGDLVLINARSDLSMPESKKAVLEFFEKHLPRKRVTYLLLQRGKYSVWHWKQFKDFPVLFGTTITPLASARNFNTVHELAQIKGLIRMREAGCPPERISIELGPVFPDKEALSAALNIVRFLAQEEIISFLTFRGPSVGLYGEAWLGEIEALKKKGFYRHFKAYTYNTGTEEKPHEYYKLKNYVPESVVQAFTEEAKKCGINIYRHTGHLYAKELGIRVAANRNNRVREDMRQYISQETLKMTAEEFAKKLKESFDIECPVEKVEAGVFKLHTRGTEDIAHTVGSEFQCAVLFTDFDNQPTLEDLKWYITEGWLAI